MATYGVTPTGLVVPTLAEIVADWNDIFTGVWPGITTDPRSRAGQWIGVQSQREAMLWAAIQAIYTSRNINEATGADLDNLLSELGLRRIDASYTLVEGALFWGNSAVVIPSGSQVRQSSALQDFTSQLDVTINHTTPRAIKIQLETPSASIGDVYQITLNGSDVFLYNSYPGEPLSSAASNFASQLNTAAFGVTAYTTDVEGEVLVDGSNDDIDAAVNFTWAIDTGTTLSFTTGASAGTLECNNEGAIAAPANTIDTIMTPVSGWLEISNPLSGITGRESETDDEFRLRAALFYASGKATEIAIRQALLNEVAGVNSVAVVSNRSDIEVDGRPPHSFETVISGGTVEDIANVIWNTEPAGIEPFGRTEIDVPVVDDQGTTQYVSFTRPTEDLIWVKISRALNPEQNYPTDGDDQIKEAIVEWSLTRFTSGDDVIRQQIGTPVYTVPGIGDITIQLGDSVTSTPPTTYNAVNITVDPTNIAIFDTARIIVEDL